MSLSVHGDVQYARKRDPLHVRINVQDEIVRPNPKGLNVAPQEPSMFGALETWFARGPVVEPAVPDRIRNLTPR